MTWAGDPSITWRIALTSVLADPIAPEVLHERMAALHRAQGWPGEGVVVRGSSVADLRAELGERPDGVLAVGAADDALVISAHHARVDGLGLLAVLSCLSGSPVSSSARGVADRPDAAGPVGTAARRLAEALLAPPAPVATPSPSSPRNHGAAATGDVYREATVLRPVRTAALAHAAVGGLVAHNEAVAARTRHVAVAIGVSRAADPSEPADSIRDRSALVRLRDAEDLAFDDLAELLRTAPTQRPPDGAPGPVARVAMRVLSRRLGSSVLVSHLGTVTAPAVRHLAFHPVTAGGSGLSLGAVTLDGATTLTLRARAATWDDASLDAVLAGITSRC